MNFKDFLSGRGKEAQRVQLQPLSIAFVQIHAHRNLLVLFILLDEIR